MRIQVNTIEQTQQLASLLANNIQHGMTILLEGPLGSGKTTFTQFFGKTLGIKRAIKSPTYTIVKEYDLEVGQLIHIDAYRLEDGGADTIDFDSYLNANNIILIEWSQFLSDYLPKNRLVIQFAFANDVQERMITLTYEGTQVEAYQTLLNKVGEQYGQ